MTNEGFREYVNGNMLLWAANVKSTEGYRGTMLCFKLMHELHCTMHLQIYCCFLRVTGGGVESE